MSAHRPVQIQTDLVRVEATAARVIADRPGCQIVVTDDDECGLPPVVARVRQMTCGHEEWEAVRYHCADHADLPLKCWHCGAPIHVAAVFPLWDMS